MFHFPADGCYVSCQVRCTFTVMETMFGLKCAKQHWLTSECKTGGIYVHLKTSLTDDIKTKITKYLTKLKQKMTSKRNPKNSQSPQSQSDRCVTSLCWDGMWRDEFFDRRGTVRVTEDKSCLLYSSDAADVYSV